MHHGLNILAVILFVYNCFMKTVAEIGAPVGLQKEVFTIESNSKMALFGKVTLTIFLGPPSQTQGSLLHTLHNSGGSFSHAHGSCPHTLHGFGVLGVTSSGGSGGPSHSSSLKCSCAFTKSKTVKKSFPSYNRVPRPRTAA